MEKTFFNQDGHLNLAASVHNHPSYAKIMADKCVDPEELAQQYQLIKGILNEIEEKFTPEQKQLVKHLLTEAQVYKLVRDKFHAQIEFDGDFYC